MKVFKNMLISMEKRAVKKDPPKLLRSRYCSKSRGSGGSGGWIECLNNRGITLLYGISAS